MANDSFLSWPFFEDSHRTLASKLKSWAATEFREPVGEDPYVACPALVDKLGKSGWLKHTVPKAFGGVHDGLDVRSLCIIRETLAWHSGLADFSFAMQGLGSGPITLFGSDTLQHKYLPGVSSGNLVAAFALSEKEAGSNVAAIATSARQDGSDYVIDGTKTWISNAGIADFYLVFARTGEESGAKGLSAFVVDRETNGLEVTDKIEVMSSHPLGTLRLDGCRVPTSHRIGAAGEGFKVAMATLDVFRATVGAAAVGFAKRALDEATRRAQERVVFEQPLAAFQMTRERIADMAVDVDASALLVYRAAWAKDNGAERVTREAAMAKLYATESAQRVIDSAIQIFGGEGVVKGTPVETLYRDIRPLRIYEGTTEIQKLIVARETLEQREK